MRELMTPTLGGTNKLSASFKAANGNGVARQAASKIMEPTKAYTASKRPSIPYVKKESRWGPRYVLRKPSEYTAFNPVKAVPAADRRLGSSSTLCIRGTNRLFSRYEMYFIARRPTSEVSTHNNQKRGNTVIIEFDNHGIT